MKPWIPFMLVAALIVGALWYLWPQMVKAREGRQDELDSILDLTGQRKRELEELDKQIAAQEAALKDKEEAALKDKAKDAGADA